MQERVVSASRRIWARWTVAFTLGELIGFGAIAVSGAAIAMWLTSGLEPTAKSLILYAAAIVGGLGEGAVLGWFQTRVLIEIIPELTARAAAVLDTLGYRNVMVRCGDGYDGWPEKAPFDGIIVTAAAPAIPVPLVRQLRVGGRIVIPIGAAFQELEVHVKRESGLELLFTLPVRFVPMTGKVRESGGR